MKTATAIKSYAVLVISDSFNLITDNDDEDCSYECIDQPLDEELEVWKTRDDGFHFVFSALLDFGYWVNPALVKII